MWPFLFAAQTLAVSRNNPLAALNSEAKITRGEVQSIVAKTRLLGWSNRWLERTLSAAIGQSRKKVLLSATNRSHSRLIPPFLNRSSDLLIQESDIMTTDTPNTPCRTTIPNVAHRLKIRLKTGLSLRVL
ncbi:MAG: hypothetical protein R3C44_12750 [Chloroflexota bacterium]